MKLKDIALQGMRNLLRHRGRTLLTVLGVVVGCCSVVIMISIGIGMNISTQAALEQMGDLNVITVSQSSDQDAVKLDASAVLAMRSLKNVSAVIPKIRYYGSVNLYSGAGNRYKTEYISLIGEDLNQLKLEGFELTQGEWDSLRNGEVLAGEFLAYDFTDTKRPEGMNRIERYSYYDWETDSYTNLPDPYVDVMKDGFTLVIGDEPGSSEAKNVKAELKAGGVVKGSGNKNYEVSDALIMDIDALQKLLSDYARISGDKSSAAEQYSEILVVVDDITHVESAEKDIRKLGFRTSSMESIRKPMEQDLRQKQMLLGCVGAVSLFVAALGIANTMIMAISERVREIGVMKALGCFLGDIRKMFLLEAACIGLTGGITGIGLSYIISAIMNAAGGGALFGNDYDYLIDSASMDLSVIPWWLALLAVAFSILTGVAAGLYPAEKAVRVPALDAIKHE